MFKKIRKYITRRKKMQVEILETLATICLYLDWEGQRGRNRYGEFMRHHFQELKGFSEELRRELHDQGKTKSL